MPTSTKEHKSLHNVCSNPACKKLHYDNGHHYGECECWSCMAEMYELKNGKRSVFIGPGTV